MAFPAQRRPAPEEVAQAAELIVAGEEVVATLPAAPLCTPQLQRAP
jgi:hypothetical protein